MKVIKRDQPKQSRRTNALARFYIQSRKEWGNLGQPEFDHAYGVYKARKERELTSLKASLGVQ